MFSNIGWMEIFFIAVIAVIIIGPERLPEVIKDIRAAIYAARKGIRNARAELDGTLDEFEEFREPISQAAEWGRMGPRAAITKALFDGDDEYLDTFDPKKQMKEAGVDTSVSPREAMRRSMRKEELREKAAQGGSTAASQPTHQVPPPKPQQSTANFEEGGGFSWTDFT